MPHLLILGAGTAGTVVANKLRPQLPRDAWTITVVAREDVHDYQPGYLFLPFGTYTTRQVRRTSSEFLPEGVEFVIADIDRVDPQGDVVHLADGRTLPYDYLLIATGTTPRPDQTPGMPEGLAAGTVHEFYTYEGAQRLATALADFAGGHVVVHVCEMPIKCPVAPLEFVLLAEDWFRGRGLHSRTEITYATPLPGAFTRPIASRELGDLLDRRGIFVEPDFAVERIDPERNRLIAYDGRELAYDLLVTIPVNMGADFVARSGLGDELNFVPVDPHTMRSPTYPKIFALGDATNLPTSKAGSVAHFSAEIFCENFVQLAAGAPMTHRFDGHANCFVESGRGKALLLDFNYDTEPLPGLFPAPVVGPLNLLKESRANHLAKLAARPLYWDVLLRGRPVPWPTLMSMKGKRVPEDPAEPKEATTWPSR